MKTADGKLRKVVGKAVYGGIRQRKPEPSETDRRLAEKRGETKPFVYISLDAAMRFALTELRSYDERELNERIARISQDHCATRRYLVEFGLMTRSGGVYEFTETGEVVWRVERFICEWYLVPACREALPVA